MQASLPGVARRVEENDPERPVPSRRPRVLLAATGSVAAIKFHMIVGQVAVWAEVRTVVTDAALHFIDQSKLPPGVALQTDEDDWGGWKKIGDSVLHIDLRKWADVMIIAPLSANTLAKIAGGLCDNLVTAIVRAWDYRKPLLLAPAMNTFMWDNPLTARHLAVASELGARIVPPVSKVLACGDVGNGAMAEPATIEAAVRDAVHGLTTS